MLWIEKLESIVLHQFHDTDRFILLHLVAFVSGLTVGLIVGVADLGSLDGVVTGSHQRIVANSHSLIEGLNEKRW